MTAAGQLLGRRCLQRCSSAVGDMMSRILALCTQCTVRQDDDHSSYFISALWSATETTEQPRPGDVMLSMQILTSQHTVPK